MDMSALSGRRTRRCTNAEDLSTLCNTQKLFHLCNFGQTQLIPTAGAQDIAGPPLSNTRDNISDLGSGERLLTACTVKLVCTCEEPPAGLKQGTEVLAQSKYPSAGLHLHSLAQHSSSECMYC